MPFPIRRLLLATAVLAVTGCQTSGGFQSGLSGFGQASYPSSRIVKLSLRPDGRVRLGVGGKYRYNNGGFKTAMSSTLSGSTVAKVRGSSRLKHLPKGPDFAFITPRPDVDPLGTVYRKPVRGFAAESDTAGAAAVSSRHQVFEAEGLTLSARILKESLEAQFTPDAGASSGLQTVLRTGGSAGFTSFTVLAVADDVKVEYLPHEVTHSLGDRIKSAPGYDPEMTYFVADKIIRARKVAFLSGTFHMNEGRLDKAMFDAAVRQSDTVSQRNGVYLRTHSWDTPQVIGVGYSILPINRSGKIRVGRGGVPTPVEPMLARQKRVPNLVSR